MSASLKLALVPDDATRDLWRVAETDGVDELARILRRVGNVNARNEHGMTALMRAAYHGHANIVSALLEHGADPNLTRDDKFTALALAAFFGHTETVRILIEHGAKTEVITRCGASAKTWATARTFQATVRCLESHAPARAPVRGAVAPPVPVQAVAVKMLKDPPEIWDLVHEAPQGFNPRSAFISRIQSMKTSFAFRIAAVLVISTACVVGALVLRRSEAHTLSPPVAELPQNQVAIETEVSPPASTQVSASDPVVPQQAVENVKASSSRNTRFVPRSKEPVSVVVDNSVESQEVSAAAPAVVETPKVEPRISTKVNTPPSPQLIAPAKSAPPKAKVIQWP